MYGTVFIRELERRICGGAGSALRSINPMYDPIGLTSVCLSIIIQPRYLVEHWILVRTVRQE